MALTGELKQLHITDIIQLIHTTRQSGTLSVSGSKGESRIIFSNGYIVSANHLNNRVRIGSVLVAMKAVTPEDLKTALDIQNKSGSGRRPLISTLRQMGKLKDDLAFKALKKLIEITVVELISWKEGTFSFDADAIAVSSECSYNPGEMEQEQSFDAQMVLMDALRIYDERERDRMSGQEPASSEELYVEVLPTDNAAMPSPSKPAITADILGLGDLDQLENRIPVKVVTEDFDPVAIHRKKIHEYLADLGPADQDRLLMFLKEAMDRSSYFDETGRQRRHSVAIILFSKDQLLTHLLMTVCKNDGISIFGTSQQDEIERIFDQCRRMDVNPVLVLDEPGESGSGLKENELFVLRLDIQKRHPLVSCIQIVSPSACHYAMRCLGSGVRTVFPKPERAADNSTFVSDLITFLGSFLSMARQTFINNAILSPEEMFLELRHRAASMRLLESSDEVAGLLLDSVSLHFGRSVLYTLDGASLMPKRIAVPASGNPDEEDMKKSLVIPLGRHSLFDDVIESGQPFYGETEDEVISGNIYSVIGSPKDRKVFILPLKVSGQTRAIIYADFGDSEHLVVYTDAFEVLAIEAGIIIENAVYRQKILKSRGKN